MYFFGALLVLGVALVFGQRNPTVTDPFPSYNIAKHKGVYGEELAFECNSSTEHVVIFPTSQSMYPYRISAWTTNAKKELPVLVMVTREREVLSWALPFMVDSYHGKALQFKNTSRTMCHSHLGQIGIQRIAGKALDLTQNFIVSLSTLSRTPVDIVIRVQEEPDFFISLNKKYSVVVSPSQTMYYMYRFPNNKTENVMLELASDDDTCLTVSIQECECPVFDLEKDIKYKGKYQTINRKGGMNIRRKDFPNGFFLVFVSKPDNYECSQEHSILPAGRTSKIILENRTSVVNFKVTKGITGRGYGIASLITLGIIVAFCVLAVVLQVCFSLWGSVSKIKKTIKTSTEHLEEVDGEYTVSVHNKEDRRKILAEKKLTLDLLSKDTYTSRRRSYNYLWHILSIAVFYSIPVVQLVITYQRVVNRTGDQDMCYFNFLCAHPAFGLSDFNHIFSNVGYVFIGILFLAIVCYRHNYVPNTTMGVPVQYGVFYAMGIALIIEGLLSACYHICPSQSNYQFDTSFMYVMAVLCMIKLYQNRHPDINATAYATFTVLGVAIFLAMLGILNGSLAVWIFFVVVYGILCVYISVKIYFISFVWDGIMEFKRGLLEHGFRWKALRPIRTARFVLLFMANLINYAMLVSGLLLYNTGVTDFGTFLLGLLMGNSVLYAIFYTVMKLACRERICWEAIFYGLLGVASWATATYFFLDNATLWTVTPAVSRQLNQSCIVMDFYDKHDVWHLLSAPALYFSFMFLMCLDDDVIDQKRTELEVF